MDEPSSDILFSIISINSNANFSANREGEASGMLNIDYLAGSIYHMVHFANLPQIFQRRAILSKEKVIQEKIGYQSIAYEKVVS